MGDVDIPTIAVSKATIPGAIGKQLTYHLCWMNWASNSALIMGGSGCRKPEENSVMEGGKELHPEQLAAAAPAAAMRRVEMKCMMRMERPSVDR